MRTRAPTTLEIDEMAPVTLKRRRTETFDMALMVHGGTKNYPKPAFDGLYDTLSKRCKTSALGNYVLKDSKVANYVINNSNKKDVITFENSNANILRSIATYYNAGVMGKRKYQAVRLATSMKSADTKRGGNTSIQFTANCPIPKLLTYNKLRKQINAIDIGKVYSVEEQFSAYIQDENVKGCYRDLREYLPRLAKFYLGMQKTQKGALKWFAETEGTFLVAFGGDGCPFGKTETACSFLVSFLNTGKRVASSSDNFLVFGGNVEESSPVVKKYAQYVYKQIADMKGKVFEIGGLPVTFRFEELPNDMKMLAMLAGELSNSSTYFSTFGNVSTNDCTDLDGTLSLDPNSKWKPWVFEERIKVVKKVESLKSSLDKKVMSAQNKRNKITQFIAQNKSRQEFTPLLGKLIDKAHVEPLHLKNNAWGYFFKVLLKEAIAKSKISVACKTFAELPQDSCLVKLVNALQHVLHVGRLAKKVKKWFDENQCRQNDLQYRFTGKESRAFCHHFSTLLSLLKLPSDSRKQIQTILALHYVGLRLRDCCSIINRFDMKQVDIDKLSVLAREYYRANALFLPTSVNPTIWTIGNVVPFHAQQVYDKYKQGLLTVTMEGREAKHLALLRLKANTTYQNRWQEIVRHEFIMLIWLPEQQHKPCPYKSSKGVYIPLRVYNDDRYCYCGLLKADCEDQSCNFCSDNVMKLIGESVKQGKIVKGLV